MTNKRSRQNNAARTAAKKARRKAAASQSTSLLPLSEIILSVVWLWGSNCFGQLGLGEDIMEKIRPATATLAQKVLDVATGGMHTVLLLADNTLWSFGVNDDGALGRPTGDAGDAENDPTLPGQMYLPQGAKKAVQVACTDSASFVLVEDGSIYGCGTFRNERGVFGFTSGVQKQETLACVYQASAANSPSVKLSTGGSHIIAVLQNGVALSWGDGSQGQLGRIGLRHSPREEIAKANMLTPRKIAGFKRVAFTNAFCGEYSTFLKSAAGDFYACGLNNSGQLAMPPAEGVNNEDTLTMEGRIKNRISFLTPTPVEAFETCEISEVAAGKDHGLGMSTDGHLYSWGVPTYGVLGQEQMASKVEESTPYPTPKQVSGLQTKVKSIACGQVVSGCLDEAGDLYTWGACLNDMLGARTDDDVAVPRKIPRTQSMKGKKFHKIAFGGQHAAMLGQ